MRYHLKITGMESTVHVCGTHDAVEEQEGVSLHMHDLAILTTEVEYKMEVKPCDRIEDLSCQCQNVILKEGKKKCRDIMIFKIKPKPVSDKVFEVSDNLLNKAIQEDDVHFFEWLKEGVVANAREHRRDTGSPEQYNPTPTTVSPARKPFKKGKRTAHCPSSKNTAERTVEKGKTSSKKAALRCLNCGSEDHLVTNCPSAAKGDKSKGSNKKHQINALIAKLSADTLEDEQKMPQGRLNDSVDVHHLLDSGADFTVMPRSIMGRIKEIVPVKEFHSD